MVLSKSGINEYNSWLTSLKERIRRSQQRAAALVNIELLALYWFIGSELDRKISNANWGDKIVETLALDLSNEFPNIKGFSRSNIFNILKWYRFYTSSIEIVQQAVGLVKKKMMRKCMILSNSLMDYFHRFYHRHRGDIISLL